MLKEKKEDIPIIAEHFVQTISKDFGTHVKKISPEVIKIFENYDWPGNIRELSNILERILYSMDGTDDTIRIKHLPLFFRSFARDKVKSKATNLRNLKEESEKEALLHAIRVANNNKNKAANILGIHRTALYKKMKKFNLPLNLS
jgi:transcriptional regulator with PAS, ATPase and Fis domain